MKKILIVSITPNSAVDRLAEMVKKHNEHLDITVFPFHAKRYDKTDLILFADLAKDADLIDFEYWRGAEVLLKEFAWLKDKKKILTHHNPYDLDKIDPKLFDKVVVKNRTQQDNLKEIWDIEPKYIPHAVDVDFFNYNNDYDYEAKTIGMVAFRIEGKKGIKEVAQACKELDYKFLLVGHISKPAYFQEIMEVNPKTDFRQDITDEELRDAYKEMSVHVCNSANNFESGTLPILEAMVSGVPVLSRATGLVPDIYDGINIAVRKGVKDDMEDLKAELKALIEDKDRRKKMRDAGWRIAKSFDHIRMATRYAKLYNQVLYPYNSLVSVIIPTYNRVEQVGKIIESFNNRTYNNIEVIVCDDNSDDGTESTIKAMREKVDYPIKYVNTSKNGYNLAMARNMGVIESQGEVLMFLDSRLCPERDAISQFIKRIGMSKRWIFGNKGFHKTSFVENFSMIRKEHLVRGGMFNERIDAYGGMSQELRQRFYEQGYDLKYTPEAKAVQILSSQKLSQKRDGIKKMKLIIWKLGYLTDQDDEDNRITESI